MMNPAHLDLFRAVLRHGGMTRAAEALGIGQPHVSRAIARLEADLGFALFDRGHGSALPTREGEAFAHEVERTYAGLDHLRGAARRIRDLGTAPLRIACQPSLAARLVPRTIRHFGTDSPGVPVALHVPGPETIWTLVASGQCDLGLVRSRPDHAGVICEPFLTVEAVCALPRGHALTRKAAVSVGDLAGEALIAGAAGRFQDSVEDAFARAGLAPRFTHTAQYTTARCGLVAEGLGLAIVDPIPACDLSGLPIVLRPFRPALPIETVLLRPTGRRSGRLTDGFIAILRTERDRLLTELSAAQRSRSSR